MSDAPDREEEFQTFDATSVKIPTPTQAKTQIGLMEAKNRIEEAKAKLRILQAITVGIFILIIVDLIPQFVAAAYSGHTNQILPILTLIVGYMTSEITQRGKPST